jgi:hypothetical protein
LETRLVKGMTEKRRTYLVNPPLSLPSCKAMCIRRSAVQKRMPARNLMESTRD